MSRIEEALARAAERQGETRPADQPRKHVPGLAQVPAAEPSDATTVHVTEEALVVINDPLSPMAEEYRKLKEALVSMTKRERFDNLIAVTSATVGEGKSTTAVNLAASLAREFDHTVLLVDADLRRPSVHKLLGLGRRKGLSDCLQEGLDVGDLLVKTDVGRLSILPAGTPLANPAELFSSEAMRLLLEELKTRYSDRYIILDTPPVLPFAETRSISGIVDGVLLVVREGQPTMGQIEDAIDALGGKVLGIVYNAAHVQDRSSYYYYYEYKE